MGLCFFRFSISVIVIWGKRKIVMVKGWTDKHGSLYHIQFNAYHTDRLEHKADQYVDMSMHSLQNYSFFL